MRILARKKMTAREFDQAFEKGDVAEHLDLKTLKASHPVQRINVDIPKDMLQKVDREAIRIGVPRTSLLKMWIDERLHHLAA